MQPRSHPLHRVVHRQPRLRACTPMSHRRNTIKYNRLQVFHEKFTIRGSHFIILRVNGNLSSFSNRIYNIISPGSFLAQLERLFPQLCERIEHFDRVQTHHRTRHGVPTKRHISNMQCKLDSLPSDDVDPVVQCSASSTTPSCEVW